MDGLKLCFCTFYIIIINEWKKAWIFSSFYGNNRHPHGQDRRGAQKQSKMMNRCEYNVYWPLRLPVKQSFNAQYCRWHGVKNGQWMDWTSRDGRSFYEVQKMNDSRCNNNKKHTEIVRAKKWPLSFGHEWTTVQFPIPWPGVIGGQRAIWWWYDGDWWSVVGQTRRNIMN